MKKSWVVVVCAAIAAATLSGCAEPHSTAGHDNAALVTTAAIAATQYPRSFPGTKPAPGFTLPVDAYAPTPAQLAYLAFAKDVATRSCLQQLGYKTPNATFPAAKAYSDPEDRRYGVTSVSIARAYGYHLTPDQTVTPSAASAVPDYGDAPTSAVDGVAAPGRASSANASGQVVPSGGCAGKASRSLASTLPASQADLGLVYNISELSYQSSLNDQAVNDAFGTWSSCMSASGFNYPTPVAASNEADLTTPTVSAREIATAVADATCKSQANLVAIWSAAETAVQDTQIKSHEAQLIPMRTALQTQLANAQRLTDVAPPSR